MCCCGYFRCSPSKSQSSKYIVAMRNRLNTMANMTMQKAQHQSVVDLRIILLANPMAVSQRISQQRQYLGRCPVVAAGGVMGAKYACTMIVGRWLYKRTKEYVNHHYNILYTIFCLVFYILLYTLDEFILYI